MSRLHRKISTLLAMGMTFWLSGCYAIIDDIIECENSVVNMYRAHRAWYAHNDYLDDVEHRRHYKKGFMDGYQESATNGPISSYGHCQSEQCLPLMPPRCYWKHCYQNCEGRQKIDAWYQGYAQGAVAASEDGVYTNYIIPTYGLNHEMQAQGAYHTSTLEEDVTYDENGQLVPEPEDALPKSDELVPIPKTYDDPPQLPPAEDATSVDPVSGASFESYREYAEPEWATQPPAASVADLAYYQDAVTPRTDQKIPNARFTGVTASESTSVRAQWESPGEFVLPIGYEGFRAPEWSEGANRE